MAQKQEALQEQEKRSLTKNEWVAYVQTHLMTELQSHAKALPDGFNKDRFVLNCMTLLQDMMRDSRQRDALRRVEIGTIPLCLAKGAYLGLDFFNGECYAIPYGTGMNFQTDYKGEIKLCKKYSRNPIKDIYAKLVKEGDYFEESVEGGVQSVTFRPVPFSDKDIIGVFAVVLFMDGTMMYDAMSRAEVEKVRNAYSKAKDSPAWKNSFGEMCKKTVLRRLCKLIDLDFDTIEARRAFTDGGDVDFQSAGGDDGYEGSGVVDVFAEDTGSQVPPVDYDTASQVPPEEQKAGRPDAGGATEDYGKFEEAFAEGAGIFGGQGGDEHLPWE